MKKVAIVLCLSTLVILMLVLGGKMATGRGHLSANNPDELPIYLITLGNFRETPVTPCTQSYIVTETQQVPLETIKEAVNIALKYYQDNYKSSR